MSNSSFCVDKDAGVLLYPGNSCKKGTKSCENVCSYFVVEQRTNKAVETSSKAWDDPLRAYRERLKDCIMTLAV